MKNNLQAKGNKVKGDKLAGKKRKTKKSGSKEKTGAGIWFLLGVILLFALVMRLYQPGWYDNRQFHPDERWIVSSAVPGLDYWGDKPIGLQYGSLPLYILMTYNKSIEFLHKKAFRHMDMGKARLAGARAISGLVDTGTIIFIFFTCVLLFNRRTAITAAALLAFTALHIHASHFFTVDTFVAFFVAAVFYFSARIYKKGGFVNYIAAGIFLGAALASKTAAIPVVLAVITAHVMRLLNLPKKGKKGRDAEIDYTIIIPLIVLASIPVLFIKELYGLLLTIIIGTAAVLYLFRIITKGLASKKPRVYLWMLLCMAGLITFITFFVCMPHAILDFNKFSKDQNYQKRILVTGEGDVPYNRQYRDTTPYIYYIKNLVLYTMGIPYGAAAVAAFVFYIGLFIAGMIRRKVPDKETLLLLSFMVPYFAIIGLSFAKFNRYMLPFTPFLAMLTAKAVYDIYIRVKSRFLTSVLRFIIIGGAVFYAAAFMNIYFQEHPWVQASKWFYKNVPAVQETGGKKRRTVRLNEMWGDDLPVHVKGKSHGGYRNLKWALQEREDNRGLIQRKLNELSSKLSRSDYVMMADKRAYGTYRRLPEDFPLNYFYYSTMLKEPQKLGFEKAYEKAVYPSFIGITIKDDKADESFQLYDHPHVYIFRNTKYFTPEKLGGILEKGWRQAASKYNKKTPPPGKSESPAKELKDNPNIGKFRDRVFSILPSLSVLLWYLLIQLLAFAAMPLKYSVFNNLRDKGYGFSKVLGIFLFTWINWMLVSAGIIKFYQVNLWVLFAGLAAASAYVYVKNRQEVIQYIREKHRHILITETIFLAAYMFFIYIKLYCPDIHNISGHGYNGGGEPMGMAYLSGIFNDVVFPPHDPWLSGFTLNYYYWGQLMLATLTKFLGYMPAVTYNLSLAALFSLAFICAFTIGYNLTGKYRYGIFSGFLVAMAGNFHALEFIYDAIIRPGNLQHALSNILRFQFIWDATRIYPHPVITELPFFSYLYGDLHAHNIVIPLTLLALGLVLNILKEPNKSMNVLNSMGGDKLSKIISVFMLSLALGSMLTINTWNFPPVFILIAAGFAGLFIMLVKNYKKPGLKNTAANLLIAGGILAGVTALAYVLFLPFHLNFTSPYKAAVRMMRETPAGIYTMFKFFSIFFFLILMYVYFIWEKGMEGFAAKTGIFKIRKKITMKKLLRHADRVYEKITGSAVLLTKVIVVVLTAGGFIYFAAVRPPFAALLIMAVTVLWMLVKSRDAEEVFTLSAVFVAIGIIWGTELFVVADGRMNTVFKFYMVAWTFLGAVSPYFLFKFAREYAKKLKTGKKERLPGMLIITGAVLAAVIGMFFLRAAGRAGLFEGVFVAVAAVSPLVFLFFKNRAGKITLYSAMVFILVPLVLYPFLSAFIKMNICSSGFSQKPRINGLAYMGKMEGRRGSVRDFNRYDYGAIQWINNNFKKIEPVLEAPGKKMYTGVSRISIFTGMPTLVGWGYQVGQQSGRGVQVSRRYGAADRIYSSDNMKEALEEIKKYGIKYIYAGPIENKLYGSGTEKFDDTGKTVYRNEKAALYRMSR